MGNKSSIMKDLAKYLPEVFVPTLIAFISIPIYTKIFDPSAYGNFNIVKITIVYMEKCSIWIGGTVTRYYSEYEEEGRREEFLTTVIKVLLLIVTILVSASLIILKLIDISEDLKSLFNFGMIVFGVGIMTSCLRNFLRMQRKIITHSIFSILMNVLSFVFGLYLILTLKMNLEAIFVAYLATGLLLFPFLWRISVGNSFNSKKNIDSSLVKKFASYGVPLTIASLAGSTLDFSDRYIIKILMGSYAVGVYSACYNVVWNSLSLIVTLFYMMEEPLAMKIYVKKGEEGLKQFLNQETRLFLLVLVPLVVIMISFADSILSVMLSKKYISAKTIVPYIAVSVAFYGIILKYRLGIMAKEKTKLLMYVTIAAAFLNVVLNIILIPIFKLNGAAIATFTSFLLYLVLTIVVSNRFLAWDFPVYSLARILLSGIISVFVTKIVMNSAGNITMLTFNVLLYLSIYTLILFGMGEIKVSDIYAVKELCLKRSSWIKKDV